MCPLLRVFPLKRYGSQRQRSFTAHGLDTSYFPSNSRRRTDGDHFVGHMPTRPRKRHSRDRSSRRVHADETIRELRENIHELLSAPLGFRGHNLRSRDRWGSNIATPSHSKHYSLDCDPTKSKSDIFPDLKPHNHTEAHPTKRQANDVSLGDASFVSGHLRGSSVEGSFFRLNSVLGGRNPIQCDFRKNPAILKRSEGRRAKLDEPALIRRNNKIRVRQMTLVFSKWDCEIVISTPATLFPDNSSPANVETIRCLDVLECVYLHLSEPVLNDSEEWISASRIEREVAQQSLVGRGGKTLRRFDWLGGKTVFKGLDYVGGATLSQGTGADGGSWMVMFG